MKSLQSKTIVMLSCMFSVSLALAVLLVSDAMNERRIAIRYGIMEQIARNLNTVAGWQAKERARGVVVLENSNPTDTILNQYDDVGKKVDDEARLAANEIKRLLDFEPDPDITKKLNEWLSAWEVVQTTRSKVKSSSITADAWIQIATSNIDNIFALRAIVFSPHDSREKVLFYNTVLRANIATLCEYAGRERALFASQIALKKAVTPEQRESLKSWRAIVDDNVAKVLLLKTQSSTPQSLVATIRTFETEFLGQFQQLREQVYAASSTGQTYPVTTQEWIDRTTKAIDSGLEISNSIGSISAEASKNISTSAINAMIVNISLLSFSFMVFVISIYFMRRSVIKPITGLVTVMDSIAAGDLLFSIPETNRQDEIGLLSNAAKIMQRQLHNLILEVHNHAAEVYSAAQQIAGSIEEQAATTNQMSASVAEITSTMEELSASSTQIAEHSLSVANIATQNWENSKKGSEAMNIVLTKMADIRTDNQLSLKEIVDLGKRSKEISKVMEIINTVADQTKLIAFNAALEASSAGDAGRRFSVVAAEIRRLADSVTESTNEIDSKINDIQESTSRLIITSEKGSTGIADGLVATTKTSEQLGKLVEAANQTNSAAKQISLSTQQQKTASNQIVVALREIATASNQTVESLSHISQISHDMATLSAKLNELVEKFNFKPTIN